MKDSEMLYGLQGWFGSESLYGVKGGLNDRNVYDNENPSCSRGEEEKEIL